MLKHYYRGRFPSFWKKFDVALQDRSVISVRESKFELQGYFDKVTIDQLVKQNPDFFEAPSVEELSFVAQIYSVAHFQHNLDKKKLLQGGYFADPLIIAKAKIKRAAVVTEEHRPLQGARIPNICQHFGIECMKLEGFLVNEDWKF